MIQGIIDIACSLGGGSSANIVQVAKALDSGLAHTLPMVSSGMLTVEYQYHNRVERQ